MPNQFVILAHARTGSYNLVSLLDSTNDVSCYGELFKTKRIELNKFRLNKISFQTTEQRDTEPARFLSELRNLTPRKHFGFKIFPQHLVNVPPLESVLESWKWVLLFRDPLETYASYLRAHSTQVWTHRKGQTIEDSKLKAPVRFTEESLAAFIKTYGGHLAKCREVAATRDSFAISYDQIGEPATMAALLSFIGSQARPEELTSTYRKQFTGSLADGFENWDELQDHIEKYSPFPILPETTVRAS
ncbi:sulfotransferase family protein [Rhizobium alvei]|uniref:Sulfotransferase domain-containing protein n=1 Tax=Rhizobium alvei TaxID=1132659 RepID=A0ABT8YJU0_9HYPH|nr:hypothetical protein [Rhizobium alvei]MDO6963608.1 hypothetical protein [Rhizobium alvei]